MYIIFIVMSVYNFWLYLIILNLDIHWRNQMPKMHRRFYSPLIWCHICQSGQIVTTESITIDDPPNVLYKRELRYKFGSIPVLSFLEIET